MGTYDVLNKKLLIVACAAVLFLGIAGSVQEVDALTLSPGENVFSIDSLDPILRKINPDTGDTISSVTITLAGETVRGGAGLAFNPVDGKLYALLKIGDEERQLVTIDPITGIATDIGQTDESKLAALAFNSGGTLFAATTNRASVSSTLFTMSTVDASTVNLCTLASSGGISMGFNPVDGKLYHYSRTGSNFDRIDDTSTGAGNPCGVTNIPTTAGGQFSTGLTFRTLTGVFLLSEAGTRLFTLSAAGQGPDLLSIIDAQPRGLAIITVPRPPGGPPGQPQGVTHQQIAAELQAIEAKLDPGGSFFNFVSTGFTNIQTAITNAVTTITDAISSAQTTIVNEINANEVKIDDIEAKLDSGTSGLAAIKGVIDTIDTEVTNIEAKLDDSTTGLAAIKTGIDNIETETDKIQMVKDDVNVLRSDQYVPFFATINGAVVCDEPDGDSGHTTRYTVSGTNGNDFMVTGFLFDFFGKDITDQLRIKAFGIDGNSQTATVDFSNLGSAFGFDIMGMNTDQGGTFPHQVTVQGSNTLIIDIFCNAGSTGPNLGTISNQDTRVSGWKQGTDSITVTANRIA